MEDTKPEIKILLVDDREDNLFSMQTVLEKDGYYFRQASSGQNALKILLKEVDFTLILMDVEMPNLNGFETASLIYERDKLRHIPIIFITANSYSDDYVFKGYKTGGVDYIYKPINPGLLRAKVAVFVELYRKNHQLMAQEHKLQMINIELEQRVEERTEQLLHKNIELEKINTELTKVNNDLDNFVYTASHDLKSPISNIEGLVMILKDTMVNQKSNNKETDELIEMIDKSIDRFKRTIQDLTEIIKIQKNLDDESETINLSELIEDIKLSISEVIADTNTTIICNLKDCNTVKFSRKNLKSIIYNLLSNAIKYRSPVRRAEVRINTKKEKGFIVISVKDNGLGMNQKDTSKIFSMFKRLHKHVDGSGIGLYLVKRIVTNVGGKIDVESEVGKGSTFKVYLKNAV